MAKEKKSSLLFTLLHFKQIKVALHANTYFIFFERFGRSHNDEELFANINNL